MGLDVYLYHYDDYANAKRIHEIHENETNAIFARHFPNYEQMTGEQKDAARIPCNAETEKLETELGITDDRVPGETKIEIDSSLHPEHMFKIGYWRSSYNDAGIDRVLGNLTGMRLCDIACRPGDEYEFCPAWPKVKAKADEAIDKLRAGIETDGEPLGVSHVAANMFTPPSEIEIRDDKSALEAYRKTVARTHGQSRPAEGEDEASRWFSSRDGEFYLGEKCLQVRALIPGFYRIFNDQPCVYVIHKSGDLDWYREALEVVRETAEYVLRQKDPQNFYLHWSG